MTVEPSTAANRTEVPQPLPVWLSVLVILLALVGGGWLVHWYIDIGNTATETRLLDSNPTPDVTRMAGPNTPPPIQKEDGNVWSIRSNIAVMRIEQEPGKPPIIRALNYTVRDFIPQDVINRLGYGRNIANQDRWHHELNLTDQQVQQLKALTPLIGMATEPGDRDRLKQLWTDYQNAKPADKPAAERAITAGLIDVARKSVEATKQVVATRAAKIKDVLSDDQWKKFYAAVGQGNGT